MGTQSIACTTQIVLDDRLLRRAEAEPVSEFCRAQMGAILIHDVPHGFVVELAEAQLLGDRVVQLGRRAIKGSKRP